MPRGKRTRRQLGLGPAQGPANWEDDHRSKLNCVMARLLGRPSNREDIVFEVRTTSDEAALTCGTLQPPRRVTIPVEEFMASWSGPRAEEGLGDPEVPDTPVLLELLAADFLLPPTSSASDDKEERTARRLSVQGSLRKSIERQLSKLLLKELVDDGILVPVPNATNCSNAFELGPRFVAPLPQSATHSVPKIEKGEATSAQLIEMLDAVLSGNGRNHGHMKPELYEVLQALCGREMRKVDVLFEELSSFEAAPQMTLSIPPLDFVADYEHKVGEAPYQRKAAEEQLCLIALEHFREQLVNGNLVPLHGSPSGHHALPSNHPVALPNQKRPPPRDFPSLPAPRPRIGEPPQFKLQPPREQAERKRLGAQLLAARMQHSEEQQKPCAIESLDEWCNQRDTAFEESVSMKPATRESEVKWTATFTLPACHATGGIVLRDTKFAKTKAGAREEAAASLLEQAMTRSKEVTLFGDIEAPEFKRPRLNTPPRNLTGPPRRAETPARNMVGPPMRANTSPVNLIPPPSRATPTRNITAPLMRASATPVNLNPQPSRTILGTIPRVPIGAPIGASIKGYHTPGHMARGLL